MLALLLSLAITAPSDDGNAEARRTFAAAVAAYGGGRYDDARGLLDDAEGMHPSTPLLALISRQRGLVEDAMEERGAAIAAFMYAIDLDAQLELSSREHRADTVRLFECARRLVDADWSRQRAAQSSRLEGTEWSCPLAEPSTLLSEPKKVEEAADKDGGSLWWLWVGLGVVAVAAVGTGVAVASSGGEPYAGTSGVRIRL